MTDFCHLHVHTHYSLLDGAIRIDDLVKKAVDCRMPAVAVTDHGNLFGAIEFYTKARQAGVKPLVGYEAYVAPGSRAEKSGGPGAGNNYHLTLLAMDECGYRNLIRLASEAYLTGHHYKPRIDKELLAGHCEGLLALSGCLSGEAATAAAAGDAAGAAAALAFYRDLFGPERLYVEIMENGLAEQAKANAALVGLARELGLRLVATNDVHFLDRDDYEAHDVLLCIGTGKRRDDPNRMRFESDAFYFRTPEEMAGHFSELPEALRSTVEIAEKCNLDLGFGQYHYPRFEVPAGQTQESYFRGMVERGVRERYGDLSGRVRERMETELAVVGRMGFVGYMLIVADIVRFAREKGIPVGPGRGSAVGSIMCYALGISKLDPFKYDLIFERFINEGRNEMPDIDLDFCQSRRDEVIDYVTRKYGRDQVAQIITFGTMAARASIRDVGRVLDVPLGIVDRIAKMVPAGPGVTLQGAIEQEPEIRRRMDEDPVVGDIIRIARRLEGLVRQPGTHAAGVVVADRPLVEYCPLYRHPKTGEVTTQYEMAYIDTIGLLKIDFLGLQTLTMAHRAAELVGERTGARVDLDRLPLDDAATYRLFSRGETKGIFQFESPGMRDILTRARPDRFEDLIALNAMYRPGPMEQIDPFVNRKFGREPIESYDARVDPILAETYGIMAYQEQVMRIAQVMGGFSLSEADKLRKAMGKKKADLMAEYEEKFIAGAVEQGYARGLADRTYALMGRFAGYGFNKSHAAAYAFLAYQTAYLKANHPTEFMAALLTLDMGKTDKVAEYCDEARRMGMSILPPDANESGIGFTIVSDGHIRFGLAAVKGVGEKAVESILAARASGGPFASLIDFCERVDLRLVNKSVIECLARAGAFDSFGVARARLFAGVPRALEAGSRAQTDRAAGQASLFDSLMGGESEAVAAGGVAPGGFAPDEGLPDLPEWPEREKLANEKAVLGVYVSGHPLAGFEEWLRLYSTGDSASLAEAAHDQQVVAGGILSSVAFKTARVSGNRYAEVQLEDLVGLVEARVFGGTLPKVEAMLRPDTVVFLCGRADRQGGTPSLIVEDVVPFEAAPERFAGRVTIALSAEQVEDDSLMDDLAAVLRGNPGRSEVYFRVERGPGAAVLVRAGEAVRAGPGEQLCADVEAVLGPDRLRVDGRHGRIEWESRPRKRWARQERT